MSSSRGMNGVLSGLALALLAVACGVTESDPAATSSNALEGKWLNFRANSVFCNDTSEDVRIVVNDTWRAPDLSPDPHVIDLNVYDQFTDFGRQTLAPHKCLVIPEHDRTFNEERFARLYAAKQVASTPPAPRLAWNGNLTSCIDAGSEYERKGHTSSCLTEEARNIFGYTKYDEFRSAPATTGVAILGSANAGAVEPAAVAPTTFEICNDMLASVTSLSFAYTTPEGVNVTENLDDLASGCTAVSRRITPGTDFYVRGSAVRDDGTAVAINGPTRLRVSSGAHGAVVWADNAANAWQFPVTSPAPLDAGFLRVAPTPGDAKYTYRFKSTTLESLASTLEVCIRPDFLPTALPSISVVAMENGSLTSVGPFHFQGTPCVHILATSDTQAWVRATIGTREIITGADQFCVNNLTNFRIEDARASACADAGEDKAGFRAITLLPGKNTVFLE